MFRPIDLISKAYVAEQRLLHERPKGYGGKGNKWTQAVLDLMTAHDCWSMLDYGCGQGSLVTELYANGLGSMRLREYDPAIPGKDEMPGFADLVVCTDVLEHVENERLDAVLGHIAMLARKAIFLVIATRPSGKFLSDGRNAHLTVESPEWWEWRVKETLDWKLQPAPKSPLLKRSREWVAVLTP